MSQGNASRATEKCVLIIESNIYCKPHILHTASHLGLRVIAALQDPAAVPPAGVHRQIRWTKAGTREGIERAAQELMGELGSEHIDGVVCFSDTSMPLAARMAELLG